MEQLESLPCTKILIAHRLSAFRRADRILVLDGGRLVEVGDHQTLLDLGGVYTRLVASQLVDGGDPAPLG